MKYRVSVEVFFSDQVPETQLRETTEALTARLAEAAMMPMPKGAHVCINGEIVTEEGIVAA